MSDIANLDLSDDERKARRNELAEYYPGEVGLMVAELRQRASALRARATTFLFAILGALIGGVLVVALVHLFVEGRS